MAEYQGWTNWETWHTALLIDNERDLYEKKVLLVKRKAPLSTFKSSLMKAETMTRKYAKEQWGDKEKFEKVNWKEIHEGAMEEEYS